MRVLIVDDEPLARTTLMSALAERSDVEALDSAKDGVEAINKLDAESYDVVLLDIRMPELSGLELAERIKHRKDSLPSIIFVTAYSEHAVEAFEKHAIDYVLKPFSSSRIHQAIDTAARRTEAEKMIALAKVLPELGNLAPKVNRIAIKSNGRILFINPHEIGIVQAQGNYVLLRKETGSHLLRESISTIEKKLEHYGFVRIHRSILVNRTFVEEIEPRSTGEYVLRIRGGKELTVTRTYKKNLRSMAGLWIGADSFGAN